MSVLEGKKIVVKIKAKDILENDYTNIRKCPITRALQEFDELRGGHDAVRCYRLRNGKTVTLWGYRLRNGKTVTPKGYYKLVKRVQSMYAHKYNNNGWEGVEDLSPEPPKDFQITLTF